MFMLLNGLRIVPVNVRRESGSFVTVSFEGIMGTTWIRVRHSRLFQTAEEAQAALNALKAKRGDADQVLSESEEKTYHGPFYSREMERRWLLDHSGSPDP